MASSARKFSVSKGPSPRYSILFYFTLLSLSLSTLKVPQSDIRHLIPISHISYLISHILYLISHSYLICDATFHQFVDLLTSLRLVN